MCKQNQAALNRRKSDYPPKKERAKEKQKQPHNRGEKQKHTEKNAFRDPTRGLAPKTNAHSTCMLLTERTRAREEPQERQTRNKKKKWTQGGEKKTGTKQAKSAEERKRLLSKQNR